MRAALRAVIRFGCIFLLFLTYGPVPFSLARYPGLWSGIGYKSMIG